MIVHLIFCFSLVSFSSNQFCQDNQFNYLGSCFSSCPLNTIPQLNSESSTCISCDITKLQTLSSDRTRCQCSSQTFQSKFSDQCTPCHYSCLTCDGQSNTNCLTCDTQTPTTFRSKNGSMCQCLQGYFQNQLLSVTCSLCHPSCLTCKGPTESDCLSCAQGRVKDQIGDCICSNGFVTNQSGSCFCPFPVSADNICRNQSTQCGVGQGVDLGKTIASIGKKGGVSKTCTCLPGLYRIKGTCGSCGPNEIYNQNKRKCQCQKGAQKFQKQCILCPSNQVFNRKTGECNCRKNQQLTETGSCIKCPPKSFYQNGQCSCILNYYPRPSGGCRRCTKRSQHPNCIEQTHGVDKQLKLTVDQVRRKNKKNK